MTNNFYPLYSKGQLAPDSIEVLKSIERAPGKPLEEQTLKEARDSFLSKTSIGSWAEDVKINFIEINGALGKIPCHLHTPQGSGPFPILLFFHGGGFVLGMLDEFDPICSRISSGAGCIVINAGYRLAPEHKHPAQVEDAQTVLEWIVLNAPEINGDSTRISVAGDSAGGNLAAVVSIIARRKKINILSQVLICPWLNLNSFDRMSYKYFGEGLWLSEKSIHWFKNHYLQNETEAGSFLVSPGLLLDCSNLPPALIITAEFDVLCDEGAEFAAKLKKSGVSVTYSSYKGMLHDFAILPGLFADAVAAEKEIVEFLKVTISKADSNTPH